MHFQFQISDFTFQISISVFGFESTKSVRRIGDTGHDHVGFSREPAIRFPQPLRPARGVEAAYQHIRDHVRPLGRDRTLHRDLEAVERLLRSGSLRNAVEEITGRLR